MTAALPTRASSPLRTYGPGLHGWGRFQPRWSFEWNGHALVCPGGVVLVVDPVAPNDDELAAIRGLGSTFHVILTNADHERASELVSRALGATLFCPAADISRLVNQAVVPFGDGHVFPGGFVALALGGLKTPGEMALYHPGRRVMVVGDALVGDPIHGLRFVPSPKIADHEAARRSVAGLLDLEFDTLLVGDGVSIPGGAHATVAAALPRIAPFPMPTPPPAPSSSER